MVDTVVVDILSPSVAVAQEDSEEEVPVTIESAVPSVPVPIEYPEEAISDEARRAKVYLIPEDFLWAFKASLAYLIRF